MSSRYEDLENTLVALFTDTNLKQYVFDAIPLPDVQYEYRPGQPRPQVLICYDGSDFTETETTSKVTQEEKLTVSFEIHSKTRRGDTGTLSIFDTICKNVLGLKLMGFDKFTLVKAGSLPGSGANHWIYYAQFTTTGHITDQQPDPDCTENILTDPEFIAQSITI